MLRISRAHTTCLFGPDQQAVAQAAPGESLLFETQDAQAGTVKTYADALNVVLPIDQANPVTGPVYVIGAQPGDALAVRILEIRLGPQGLGRVRPGRGVLGEKLRAPAANLIPIQNDHIIFNESIQFPIRPMIGTIGTAPAGSSIASYHPGPHGGNLDINAASVGATVYLPVSVPGALLSLGDVHASMGDGELTGGGIDITAEVVVQLDLHHDLGWNRPVIETWHAVEAKGTRGSLGAWCTCACAPNLAGAIRLASHDMASLLSDRLGMTYEESYILIGAAGDVRLGQAAQVGVDMTAYLCISKAILPSAFPHRFAQ
jgi:amidase